MDSKLCDLENTIHFEKYFEKYLKKINEQYEKIRLEQKHSLKVLNNTENEMKQC